MALRIFTAAIASVLLSPVDTAFSAGTDAPSQETPPAFFVATKAFVNHGGKILILRESNKYSEGTNAGFFDVVGGRVNPGEKFDDCLRREIQEETGLEVKMGRPFFVGEWRPVVRGEPWQVVGIFFECFADSDAVVLSDDHDGYKWIDPKNFENEDLIPARNGRFDLRTAFEAYLTHVDGY